MDTDKKNETIKYNSNYIYMRENRSIDIDELISNLQERKKAGFTKITPIKEENHCITLIVNKENDK